ncbi:hypothetical protein K502DRAFT_346671 [Neoconidiobolus thromboides FSU 785]|nr:hypothetical protein K502DRAFT_346671 [Neoconidiobolus thromboides FSU 785]
MPSRYNIRPVKSSKTIYEDVEEEEDEIPISQLTLRNKSNSRLLKNNLKPASHPQPRRFYPSYSTLELPNKPMANNYYPPPLQARMNPRLKPMYHNNMAHTYLPLVSKTQFYQPPMSRGQHQQLLNTSSNIYQSKRMPPNKEKSTYAISVKNNRSGSRNNSLRRKSILNRSISRKKNIPKPKAILMVPKLRVPPTHKNARPIADSVSNIHETYSSKIQNISPISSAKSESGKSTSTQSTEDTLYSRGTTPRSAMKAFETPLLFQSHLDLSLYQNESVHSFQKPAKKRSTCCTEFLYVMMFLAGLILFPFLIIGLGVTQYKLARSRKDLLPTPIHLRWRIIFQVTLVIYFLLAIVALIILLVKFPNLLKGKSQLLNFKF